MIHWKRSRATHSRGHSDNYPPLRTQLFQHIKLGLANSFLFAKLKPRSQAGNSLLHNFFRVLELSSFLLRSPAAPARSTKHGARSLFQLLTRGVGGAVGVTSTIVGGSVGRDTGDCIIS